MKKEQILRGVLVVMGLALLLAALVGLITGSTQGMHSSHKILRSEQPGAFWFYIALYAFLGLFILRASPRRK